MRRSPNRFICMILILSFLSLTLTSCGGSAPAVNKAEILSEEKASSEYPAGRFTNHGRYTEVYANESVRLLFDEKTGAVAFSRGEDGEMWTSLPAYRSEDAANIKAEILNGDKLILFDSQSCHSEDTNFTYEKTENGIKVVYDMEAEDISLTVPVVYSIKGSEFNVKTNISECTLSDGAVLVSLAMIPYMGSSDIESSVFPDEHEKDFFMVPDGCGALMFTSCNDSTTEKMCYSVYGKDLYEESVPASAGIYGIKSAENALAAAVTSGDAISVIRAFRSGADGDNSAKIYPEFQITPISGTEGKIKYGTSYDGEISVTYTCLAGESADFAGIAGSIREILIRYGFIQSEKSKSSYPLNISLVGSVDGKLRSYESDIPQALELLKVLKGKGINSINLVLEGFLTGGLRQKNISSVTVPSKLGGNEALKGLCEFAETQEINVFTGVNIVSSDSYAAKTIDGEKSQIEIYNPLYSEKGEEKYILNNTRAGHINSDISAFLNNMTGSAKGGFCVTDAGMKLYSDYTSEKGSLTEISNALKNNLSAFSVQSSLMLNGANFNTVKNADFLKELPLYTFSDENDYYESVPFIQTVLHGSYIYSGRAANMGEIPQLELLRAVEYGAAPYYTWVFSEKSSKYYEKGLSDAVGFYNELNDKLGDLADKRITDHYQYEPGVYCTEYSGSTKVYVNYNNFSAIIGEISVPPYNYIRIG